jgi:hypothetical protein
MHQPAPFHNFSNACEHLLYSLTTNQPLPNSQARIIAYYCKEILAMVELSSDTHTAATNTSRETTILAELL